MVGDISPQQSFECEQVKVLGILRYGAAGTEAYFDDRVLAHVKAVVVAKLRRDEKFTLSFNRDPESRGRCTVWLHPAIELSFEFEDQQRVALNREWIDVLLRSANSNDGMSVSAEPESSRAEPSRA